LPKYKVFIFKTSASQGKQKLKRDINLVKLN